MGERVDVIVVGSGPNGLAAAICFARAGLSVRVLEAHDEIGGGTRTAELTLPGILHDVCSASHPFGVASPFLASLPLADFGLEWRRAPIDLVHPLDGGTAGVLRRSIEETAAGLGLDGDRWKAVFAPLTRGFDGLADDVLGPILHVPKHPIRFARFGLRAGLPASVLCRLFRTEEARALLGGSVAHIMRPFGGLASSAVGVMLTTVAHVVGWPVAVGGSHAITKAMAGYLESLGGVVETGTPVRQADDVVDGRVVMWDTSPHTVATVMGDALPPSAQRSFHRWKYGPAAFKLDLAVADGIPWTARAGREAGVVHLGGDLAEMEAAEKQVSRGRMPERPFVLVGQQYLADSTRSSGGVHPVWAYAHVPNGYAGDATEAILAQIERFAPGARERVVARRAMSPADFAAYNENYVGGDILTGANTLPQLVFRPRVGFSSYETGLAGHYICSAATPPGAGVHGMGGYRAAQVALGHLGRP